MGKGRGRDGTGNQLKRMIRNESFSSLVSEKSIWYDFCLNFGLGDPEIIVFTDQMGFAEFVDLEIKFSPKSLYSKKGKNFLCSLRFISPIAKKMTDQEIESIL